MSRYKVFSGKKLPESARYAGVKNGWYLYLNPINLVIYIYNPVSCQWYKEVNEGDLK